jgi:hypothetical protein
MQKRRRREDKKTLEGNKHKKNPKRRPLQERTKKKPRTEGGET